MENEVEIRIQGFTKHQFMRGLILEEQIDILESYGIELPIDEDTTDEQIDFFVKGGWEQMVRENKIITRTETEKDSEETLDVSVIDKKFPRCGKMYSELESMEDEERWKFGLSYYHSMTNWFTPHLKSGKFTLDELWKFLGERDGSEMKLKSEFCNCDLNWLFQWDLNDMDMDLEDCRLSHVDFANTTYGEIWVSMVEMDRLYHSGNFYFQSGDNIPSEYKHLMIEIDENEERCGITYLDLESMSHMEKRMLAISFDDNTILTPKLRSGEFTIDQVWDFLKDFDESERFKYSIEYRVGIQDFKECVTKDDFIEVIDSIERFTEYTFSLKDFIKSYDISSVWMMIKEVRIATRMAENRCEMDCCEDGYYEYIFENVSEQMAYWYSKN
ncbi:hypothetical protein [[Muricauda] lutisoli]|uniref:Uncharacterized protein n=1 Tax=[Muricauda] lutisoli TaxID=2816035 RepID=A0ABS3EU73_9FLAO|nr:hypothetical protein [[Muricauda] lutisoli]MBO0329758.1 hypothetical protein [[Muricauda] lutisoli]